MYRQHEHQSTSAECGCKKGGVNSENNQFIGVSHGGKTTKIHAVVDALGNPVHFLLTGGNIFDASVAVDLLSEVKISGSNILGDNAMEQSPFAPITQSREHHIRSHPKAM